MNALDFWIGMSRWKLWQKFVVGLLLAIWWQISGMAMDVIQWELIDKIARYP